MKKQSEKKREKKEKISNDYYLKSEKSNDPFLRNFAKAILLGMKIREESFDKNEADRREREDKYPYFDDLYKKDEYESMKEAFKKMELHSELAYPIYLALHWSNDLQSWCCEILGWDEKNWFNNKFKKEK